MGQSCNANIIELEAVPSFSIKSEPDLELQKKLERQFKRIVHEIPITDQEIKVVILFTK